VLANAFGQKDAPGHHIKSQWISPPETADEDESKK
jgi:hypothetical protein